MGGDGFPQRRVGARDDEQVEVGGRELYPATGVQAAGQPPVEIGQIRHRAAPGPPVVVAPIALFPSDPLFYEPGPETLKGSHISFSPPPRFPASDVPIDFGDRLREARLKRGWTQARLAARSGVGRETVARLERGRRVPSSDTVFRLEAALDMYPDRFVRRWREWQPIGEKEPGARSRERRRELGLSLDQVAAATGVSAATLSRFEREERRTPTLLRIERSELGGEWSHLVSERLAAALGFASLEDHAKYCDGG